MMTNPLRIKRALLFCAGCFLLAGLSFSQNQAKADSLIRILPTQPDSLRIPTLRGISRWASSPDTKIQYAMMILEELDGEPITFYEARAYHVIGVAYRKKGELEKGLTYLFQAANIDKELSDLTSLAKDYSEIASCYSRLDDVRNSLDYYTRAINLLRETGGRSLQIVLLNTGYRYYGAQKYDTALLYYDEAEELFQKNNSKIGLAYTIGNRALVKWKTGSPSEAVTDLKKAIELLVPLGDEYGMADYHNQLGNIYYELGELTKASYHLSTGVKMANNIDLKEQVRDASRLLSDIFYESNASDSAYLYLRQYLSMRDSIANEEIIQELANQRADYEISLKQAEVDLANQEKRNRQILAIAMGVVALLTGIFLINYFLAYRKRKKLSQELQALNTTKDKFFSIVSHDLRGPISAFAGISSIIKGYLKQKSYGELEEMTDHIDKSAQSLSELLDNLLSWAVQQQGQVPYNPAPLDVGKLATETLEIFNSAAAAKEISLVNAIDKQMFIIADKDTLMTIFRNLVGNALKFTEKGGQVSIAGETRDGKVHISVSDTGVGMSPEQVEKLFQIKEKRSYGTDGETGLGVGLQLVKEFVTLNDGQLSVESQVREGSSFIVSFALANIAEFKKGEAVS